MWKEEYTNLLSPLSKIMVINPQIKFSIDVKIDTLPLSNDGLKEFESSIINKVETVYTKKSSVKTSRPTEINQDKEKKIKSSTTSVKLDFNYESFSDADIQLLESFFDWLNKLAETNELIIKSLKSTIDFKKGKEVEEDEEDESYS